MKVFLSYAHEQVTIAKEIAARLSANDHEVFVDKEKLSAGRNYDDLIRQKVENCDAFLFLISPESIADGKYTLSELRFMKSKYGNPSGKVLPVMVKPVLYSKIPPYLRAVTVLVPEGNAAAEVVAAIKRLGVTTNIDNTAALDSQVQSSRIEAYKKLWSLTETLPKWPKAKNVSYDSLRALSEKLRNWYFNDSGGLFLTQKAYNVYATLQAGIVTVADRNLSGIISDEHYEEVRELCSMLRRQLATDLGTRI